MNYIEISLFIIAVAGVIGMGIWKSKQGVDDLEHQSSSSYFLAGRGLSWYLVGFSLIAANISTEQFVGMSGKAADWLGMAIASYEWMAAITLVVVAFVFLPRFLKAGIYTVPEFLEYRYGSFSRTVMAVATLLILVGVPTASVIYSGAKVISGYYPDVFILGNLTAACWLIALLAAGYVFVGGLKACVWTDLVWGSALIIGGGIVAYLAFQALGSADPASLVQTATLKDVTTEQLQNAGSWERFQLLNAGTAEEGGKLHMIRPIDDAEIPWTALIIGLWIPNFFYWGLNQYIIQRTLGSKSLAEGQKGIVFAAFLKLLIPFVVVIPGILAFNLYYEQLALQNGGFDYDAAFPTLLRNLIKPYPWVSWFILAAIFGAIVSSLASMLNSASTIATMDLYKKVKPDTHDDKLPQIGRLFVVIFVMISALIAPTLSHPGFGGIFTFIQEFQGFISSGIIAIFLFGMLVPRAPRFLGWSGILLNVVLYGSIKWIFGDMIVDAGLWFSNEIAFLDRMAICFILVMLYCAIATLVKPLDKPVELPVNSEIELASSKSAKIAGVLVVLMTIGLYIQFW
ncbi:sodium/solute symporter [Catenovulum sp. 2E275]|uniref:sodium:solute symporter family transporter n=1 Tax=Catenovulum sp. 2E275 TaxID=2980497 RepID=UPI0021D23B73|nr:sodium/solute symporter [Catenovulum sp. 2E275]MCU4675769.1 sodium/solute symporter [Catenovulum sp. 2E275]